MSLSVFMLYFFVAFTAISAIALLFTKNVLYAAMLVICTLLSLAGIYVLASAEFLAMTQILVYAGGILVVIIFAIMLTSKISGKPLQVGHGNVLNGIIVGGSFFIILSYLISKELKVSVNSSLPQSSIPKIGVTLITDYALPFEVAGIVLLVALIGAAVFASTTPSKQS